MKLLLENWRGYQTLCEIESKYGPRILEEILNAVDEHGVLNELTAKDLAKKLGVSVRDLRAAALGLTVAGGITGGLGTYAADVMQPPESIETHQVEPDTRLPASHQVEPDSQGRKSGYTTSPQSKVKMDPSLNWQRAPARPNRHIYPDGFLFVPYDDISDEHQLPSMDMTKKEYLETILLPLVEKEQEAGKTGKEALKSMLYDSEGPWSYRYVPGKGYGPAFDKHPELGIPMLPLSWSVAYELYSAL